jgi:hypothetical protein
LFFYIVCLFGLFCFVIFCVLVLFCYILCFGFVSDFVGFCSVVFTLLFLISVLCVLVFLTLFFCFVLQHDAVVWRSCSSHSRNQNIFLESFGQRVGVLRSGAGRRQPSRRAHADGAALQKRPQTEELVRCQVRKHRNQQNNCILILFVKNRDCRLHWHPSGQYLAVKVQKEK